MSERSRISSQDGLTPVRVAVERENSVFRVVDVVDTYVRSTEVFITTFGVIGLLEVSILILLGRDGSRVEITA